MIQVSENAKNQVHKLKRLEEMAPDSFIRVGVKSGGCSGLSYDLSFDSTIVKFQLEVSEGIRKEFGKNPR